VGIGPSGRAAAPAGRPTVTLITGGARSGKSRYALASAEEAGRQRAYVASAEPVDDEMRRRIERHRAERGEGWSTVEEPLDLAGALARLAPETEVAVVDCLTVWLGNLVHRAEGAADLAADLANPATFPEIAALLALLDDPPRRLVLVTNELGWGIVPDNALARAFRDLAGRVNEEAARRADRVVLMVAGRPLELPGGRGG
jgi:adenosylcobinamide kinase/adenosylcobinamide-phosphate guanylyltransferase